MRRAAVPALVFLFLLSTSGLGRAQETGGSMGGSDFSSGGSSGGDTSYSGGGGGGGSDYSYTGGGGGGGGTAPLWVYLLVAVVILVVWVVKAAAAQQANFVIPPNLAPEPAYMVMGIMSLGIDWHGRKALQATLAGLAQTADTATREGRAQMLSEVSLALLRAETSWIYAGQWTGAGSEGAFNGACMNARSRFRRELVQNQQGRRAGQADPGMEARSEEGPGTVVVTVIVVTRRGLLQLGSVADGRQIRQALQDLSSIAPFELVAVEIVWSPAAEDDRMSSVELETLYPEMRLIDPATMAGRGTCEYCGGLYPKELLSCPHCGAQVKGPESPPLSSGGSPA